MVLGDEDEACGTLDRCGGVDGGDDFSAEEPPPDPDEDDLAESAHAAVHPYSEITATPIPTPQPRHQLGRYASLQAWADPYFAGPLLLQGIYPEAIADGKYLFEDRSRHCKRLGCRYL